MRVPLATYRLQFGEGFDFEDARKAVSYLDELGYPRAYPSPAPAARERASRLRERFVHALAAQREVGV